ncbi:Gldg family protein, partial [bacterium]|nr:Gldg family protein [bacterium]
MNSTLRTTLAVVCIGVITVCSVLVVGKLAGRQRVVDLTEHKLYTLSEGTVSVIGKINQPITLKLYYTRIAARKGPEQIRFWNNYFLYVRDLLEEYVSRSGGKLVLEVIDPRPFS